MRGAFAISASGCLHRLLVMFSGKIGLVMARSAAVGFLCALTLTNVVARDGLQAIPPLAARVTDTTGTLNAEQVQALESELAALEQRKGAQIAVLIVPTTQPEVIAPYATRVFDEWKLGRKGVDDGVLLIVAKNDRRVRIEVGRGLEGAIPDAAAARIIREYIAPKLRASDYYLGLHDAITALTSLIDGESLPAPLDGSASSGEQNEWPWWFVIVVIALVGAIVGIPVSVLLNGLLSIFPIRIVPIGARRAAGLLVGPLVVVALYLWAKHAGVHLYNAVPGDVPVFTPAGIAGIAMVAAWMGWQVAPSGASQKWVGGMTWDELFSNLLGAIFSALLDGLLGGSGGSSGSGGGYSGGGGGSGGGGASGSW